jgi:hypothetical protein
MDDSALRHLAEQLLTELPTVIPDPDERAPVADAIGTGLGEAVRTDRRPLLDALFSHPTTTRWMLQHVPTSSVTDLTDWLPEQPDATPQH